MSAGKIHLSLYEKYYIIAHNVCNEVHVYIRKKGKKSVSMKKLFEKWNSISLILRIVCGLVIDPGTGRAAGNRYCHSGRCFCRCPEGHCAFVGILSADQCLVSCREEPWRYH